MRENTDQHIIPMQPYIALHSEHYQKKMEAQYGISRFYEFSIKPEEENKLYAVPDGSVDLLYEMDKNGVRSYIGATVLQAKYWPVNGGKQYFGIRFEPGKCLLPSELNIKDLVNTDLEIDGDSFGKGLAEKLLEAPDISERSHIFLDEYKRHIQRESLKSGAVPLEDYIRERIYETRGNITVRELAEQSGYSECYIRRTFERVNGISPKTFEKFVRFQHVLHHIEQKKSLDELAVICGYFDQSHMIKDFKRFSGQTPELYKKMIRQLHKTQKTD